MNDTYPTGTPRHGVAHVVTGDAPAHLGEPAVTIVSLPDFQGRSVILARYPMPATDEPCWSAVQLLDRHGWWSLSPIPRTISTGYRLLDVVEQASAPTSIDAVPAGPAVVDHVQSPAFATSRPGLGEIENR